MVEWGVCGLWGLELSLAGTLGQMACGGWHFYSPQLSLGLVGTEQGVSMGSCGLGPGLCFLSWCHRSPGEVLGVLPWQMVPGHFFGLGSVLACLEGVWELQVSFSPAGCVRGCPYFWELAVLLGLGFRLVLS